MTAPVVDFHQTSINATKNQAVDNAADTQALLKTHALPNVTKAGF